MGLKVGILTPWGKTVRCGIRTYSENLVSALAGLGVEVYIVRYPRFGARNSDLLRLVAEKIPGEVDLIHIQHEYGLFNGLEGGFYGELKRPHKDKPIITTMHATGLYRIDPVIYRTSDRVIVHNEYCARRLGWPKNTVIIPHGCLEPIKCPPEDECKRALGIDPRAPLVGYLGFIGPQKGLETLIEAMAHVREAALLIGGGWHTEEETTYIQNLKQMTLDLLPGRYRWLGYVPDEQLATVYGAMRILVYPSVYISESGALLMALSHGKAVIARDLPPVREKKKKGALETFRTIRGLVAKIKMLLEDGEARHRLERAAWEYAERNSWLNAAEKHLSLYREVLGEVQEEALSIRKSN